MKRFDLVESVSGHGDFAVVLMMDLEVPFCEDGCASDIAFTPLDVCNPLEWERTFTACIVYNLQSQRTEVWNQRNTQKCVLGPCDTYVPFDRGTAKLRTILGLIKLAGKDGERFLKRHLKGA